MDIVRERDFQSLLPSLNQLDINDPRNENLIFAKERSPVISETDIFHMGGLDYSVVFHESGHSYLNYLKYQPCLRFQLLQLRDSKPYLFSHPIPLSDDIIQQNNDYKQLLIANDEAFHVDHDDNTTDVAVLLENSKTIKVKTFLQRVRNIVSRLDKRSRKKTLSTTSVVACTDYFAPKPADEMDFAFLHRKRELRPKARQRLPQVIRVPQCSMLIQVVGARY
jgi:hypothetical protein